MEPRDFEMATKIMVEAFRGKLVALDTFSDQDLYDLMVHAKVFHESLMPGHYVATIDGHVAGILYLKWKANAKLKRPSFKVGPLFKRFGIWPMILTGIEVLILDSVIRRGEMMVDFIAVSGEFRGKGIGGKLLEFGEDFARQTSHIWQYSLNVIERNQGAKKLYERKGFVVKKTENVKWLKWLTSVEKVHYMVKKL